MLFVLVAVLLLVALFAQGFARQAIGRPGTTVLTGRLAGLRDAGPVLDLSGPAVQSATPPAGSIALTFDDGPDPTWTPKVLDVLRRHHVPGTFFVVGGNAVTHPGLIRREVREGHELGVHTFTHVDLGRVPPWRQNLELSLTETALAGAGGRTSQLLRLPYSSEPSQLTVAQYGAAKRAARYGYLLVTATNDGRDWDLSRNVDQIVAAATPVGDRGAIVLLHDGGGDRAHTVEAVDRLVTELEARGDRFATVSDLMGISTAGTVTSRAGRWQGLALLWSFRLSFALTKLMDGAIAAVAVLFVLRTLVVVAFAGHHRRRQSRRPVTGVGPRSVSVLIPAFNEEVGIAGTVASVLGSEGVDVEVIVVDDGSTDRTPEIVAAMKDPRIRLVRQPNMGKAAALNTGAAHATRQLIVMLDGDTQFEPSTVARLVTPFDDPRVGAVAGNTKVANRTGLLGRWQHIEYVIGLNLDRRTLDVLGCVPTVPGAAGAFRRQAFDEAGGASSDTLAEDTDLTVAVQRAGWLVTYESEARAWTEAPASLAALWRQRYRWAYGNLQTLWKHRGALRHRNRMGQVGIPYMAFFQVLMPLIAPIIDIYSLYGIVFLDPVRVVGLWLAFNLMTILVAKYAFWLDRESARPLWALPLQQFVYRQLMYAVVVQSIMSALIGARLRWHKLERRGIERPAEAAAGGAEPRSVGARRR